MKKLVLTSVLAGTLAFGSAQAAPGVPQEDLNQIFSVGSSNSAFPVGTISTNQGYQVSTLSNQEMQATEGEFWPIVFWVAVVGGAVAYNQITSAPGSSIDRLRWKAAATAFNGGSGSSNGFNIDGVNSAPSNYGFSGYLNN